MCLTINPKYHPDQEPLTEDFDIHVFKVMTKFSSGRLRSAFFLEHYELGETKDALFLYYRSAGVSYTKPKDLRFTAVTKGLHSYRGYFKAKEIADQMNYPWDKYDTLKYNIYHAVIPRGSKHYVGQDGDVVSEKLVVTKLVK